MGSCKFTSSTYNYKKVACTHIPWKKEEIQKKMEGKTKRQLEKQKSILHMWKDGTLQS
jgi:hypothetical protein